MSDHSIAARSQKEHIGIGLLLFVMGAGFGFLVVACTLLQIQTTEAFIAGQGVPTTFQPNWSIVTQLPDMFQGQMSLVTVKSIIVGWGIELLTFVFFIAYEVCHEVIRITNKYIARAFLACLVVIFIIDFVTDMNYGPVFWSWSQALFALVAAAIVAFGWTITVSLLVGGVRHILASL